jgi:hypothetical protein
LGIEEVEEIVKKFVFLSYPNFFLGFPCFMDLMSLDEASDKAKNRKPTKQARKATKAAKIRCPVPFYGAVTAHLNPMDWVF